MKFPRVIIDFCSQPQFTWKRVITKVRQVGKVEVTSVIFCLPKAWWRWIGGANRLNRHWCEWKRAKKWEEDLASFPAWITWRRIVVGLLRFPFARLFKGVLTSHLKHPVLATDFAADSIESKANLANGALLYSSGSHSRIKWPPRKWKRCCFFSF